MKKLLTILSGLVIALWCMTARADTYTMSVDNPAKVLVYNSGDWSSPMQAEQGTHEYSFNPGEYLMIMSSNSEISLYQVLVNGGPVEDMYGSYDVELEDGMDVEIKANYPDRDCKISFAYEHGAKGFWTSASTDGERIEGFDGTELTVKAGSMLSLTGDMIGYSDVVVKVDDEQQYHFGGTLEIFVIDDRIINVSARKAETIDFTLWIDDAAAVLVTRDGKNNPIEGLLSGVGNKLRVPALNPYIYIDPTPGYDIESITKGGDASYMSPVRIDEGAEIYVSTYEIPMDHTAVVYLDHRYEGYYFNCGLNMDEGQGRKQYEINQGYNLINFSDEYDKVFINWYESDKVNQLYQNGEKTCGLLTCSPNNYLLQLTDGDVIKIFIENKPVDVEVSISASEDLEDMDGITVTRDIITVLNDWDGLTDRVFAGTMYTFAGEGISVTFNGEKAETADGVTKVVVSELTNSIVVSKDNTTGIGNVGSGSADNETVYNLQGMRVGAITDINNLPSGIYIIGGKKVAVK